VLVAGASGQLGSVIVRKLAAAGVSVRGVARDRQKLEALRAPGVEILPVDLINLAALTEACRGVSVIVSTANNNMGSGPTSPTKLDLTIHQNLCAAARNAGVKRLVYVSARGIEQDSPVDVFRIKWYIEDAIRRSGVPYVLVRPTAFTNYSAVDDVGDFVVKIVERDDVANEIVEIGGPSTLSMNELAAMVEKHLGRGGKRRHMPVMALKLLPAAVRPFNEVAARLIDRPAVRGMDESGRAFRGQSSNGRGAHRPPAAIARIRMMISWRIGYRAGRPACGEMLDKLPVAQTFRSAQAA
jgi:NADH dehydrogenase